MTPLEYIKTLLPQDEVEYIISTRAGGTKGNKGIVTQITDNFITVDLGRHRDTILLKDIESGSVVICNVPLPLEPQPDPLAEAWEQSNHSINKTAEIIGVSWPTAKDRLIKAGLITGVESVNPQASNVDWDIMWPAVSDELAKGKTAKEIATELGLGYNAVKSKIAKMRRKQTVAKVEEQPAMTANIEAEFTFERFKAASKQELIDIRRTLSAELKLIDVILSCIDATMEGKA